MSDSGGYNFEDNINTDDFNRFDIGLAKGVRQNFDPISFIGLNNYRLTKIEKDNNSTNNFTSPDSKNSVLSFYPVFFNNQLEKQQNKFYLK
jgi:hypothetical protein